MRTEAPEIESVGVLIPSCFASTKFQPLSDTKPDPPVAWIEAELPMLTFAEET
jgi:hypothetical protein